MTLPTAPRIARRTATLASAAIAPAALPSSHSPGAARDAVPRRLRLSLCIATSVALCLSASGCGSLFNEGAAAGAGVGGTLLASKITRNATVASGIGLGVLAGAQAGAKYVEKGQHQDQQDAIAEVAGPLSVGQVGNWRSHHLVKLEPDEHGRVTVNRVISAIGLDCKELVFSVDRMHKDTPVSNFYVATICRDGEHWKWASAEPATERWGSLQ
ncbi:hypothetical protein OVY01_16320 [Robbsia sp. Bb-Pol-6]|uniref:Lipoprotein n=1 Tax=Robbsia betulipollinis TaxID=2981849 RepID=A0ABT3ZQ97_9BURK|nr:hypothetical protein [Robbsia betulipollinis]MCY0388741.1 hypothetical protein [Robbsia betulipollinis]